MDSIKYYSSSPVKGPIQKERLNNIIASFKDHDMKKFINWINDKKLCNYINGPFEGITIIKDILYDCKKELFKAIYNADTAFVKCKEAEMKYNKSLTSFTKLSMNKLTKDLSKESDYLIECGDIFRIETKNKKEALLNMNISSMIENLYQTLYNKYLELFYIYNDKQDELITINIDKNYNLERKLITLEQENIDYYFANCCEKEI